MPIHKLDKADWASYFAHVSSGLVRGKRVDYVEIRVHSPEIGAQVESRWLPLRGITYDRKNDLLDVAADGLGHLIYKPETIYVEEDDRGLVRMEVIRADGTQELIEIR